jgi:hypothetical protein
MTARTSETVLFRETQLLARWSVPVLLGVLAFIWTLVYFDDRSLLGFLIPGIIFIGMTVFVLSSRLITEVRKDGLYVRFFPFHQTFQHIRFDSIASATTRVYSPIGEYGGWGIRYGLGGVGRAYNAKGDEGVQLVFKDGQKLLIGSQRAEELSFAINRQILR